MSINYLKKAIKTPSTDDHKTKEIVQNILDDIEKRRETSIKEITKKLSWQDNLSISLDLKEFQDWLRKHSK